MLICNACGDQVRGQCSVNLEVVAVQMQIASHCSIRPWVQCAVCSVCQPNWRRIINKLGWVALA